MTTLEQSGSTYTLYSDGNATTIALEESFDDTLYSGHSRYALSTVLLLRFIGLCELIAKYRPTEVHSQFSEHLIREYLKNVHIEWFIEAGIDPALYEQSLRFHTYDEIVFPRARSAFPQVDQTALLFSGGKDSIAALAVLRSSCAEPMCYYFYNHELGPSPWFTALAAYLKKFKGISIQVNVIPHYRHHLQNTVEPSWDYLSMAMAIVGAHHPVVAIGSDSEVAASYGKWFGRDILHQYDKTPMHGNCVLSKLESKFHAPLERASPFINMHLAASFLNDATPWRYVVACNNFTETERWCNQCAKCAYTQLLAYVALDDACFTAFTGAPSFNEQLVREQLGDFVAGGNRPLECIGTHDEITDLMKRAKIELP